MMLQSNKLVCLLLAGTFEKNTINFRQAKKYS